MPRPRFAPQRGLTAQARPFRPPGGWLAVPTERVPRAGELTPGGGESSPLLRPGFGLLGVMSLDSQAIRAFLARNDQRTKPVKGNRNPDTFQLAIFELLCVHRELGGVEAGLVHQYIAA